MMDLETLDPGIRKTVALIQSWGYDTTDSGDGVTKWAAGDTEAMREPHVFVKARHAYNGQALARALCVLLEESGVEVSPIGQGRVYIQMTYDPVEGSTVIGVFGVNDAMLEALAERAK